MTRLVAVLVAVVAAAAFAQTDAKAKPQQKPKPQVVEFTVGEAITGDADAPTVVIVETVQRPDFPPFFKVRDNFDDKLMQSVNDL